MQELIRKLLIHIKDNVCDICRLVADTLHIRHHFQGRGNPAEIPGHRLLMENQLHTKTLDVTLLTVDDGVILHNFLCQLQIAVCQSFCSIGNGLFAQTAHSDHLCMQLGKLLLIKISHSINQTFLKYNSRYGYPSAWRRSDPCCRTQSPRPAGRMRSCQRYALPAACCGSPSQS